MKFNAYGTAATVGRVAVTVQAASCICMAIVGLIFGGSLLGGQSRGTLTAARVTHVECLDDIGQCAVTVIYYVKKQLMQSTFTTSRTLSYTQGDATTILVNQENPTQVVENLPWRWMGVGMISLAIVMALVAVLAVNIVADRNNVAVVAGWLTGLRLLLGF